MLRLHDSLTRTQRELRPAQPDGIYRFYNCGPTVYAAAHIGNFRTFIVNDLIRRLLEIQFGKNKVLHVRNITDVDDKTIRRSQEENRPLADVTKQWTDKFHADCAALNILPPHHEPRATDPKYMREQVDMINVLLEKGNAYTTPDGSVYFKVSSYPGYGQLSRVKERQLRQGAALSTHNKPQTADADEKEDGTDFALWKAHKPEDGPNQWPAPQGAAPGRPGWHIECSAMSKTLLGPTIDLHTGGVDLLFPHHENEIAQSQCCNGQQFSHHWYHSEHLLVDGKKMSKSLNNLYTLDQLRDMGHSPAAIRYALLAGHPRKQLNFTLESLHAAEKALTTLRHYRQQLLNDQQQPAAAGPTPENSSALQPSSPLAPVLDALRDDLNTPAALGALFTYINTRQAAALADFDQVIQALGLDLAEPEKKSAAIPAEIQQLADRRWAAKTAKDYALADQLRQQLAAAGWTMLDKKDTYTLAPQK